jgi:hypothetical protein
MLKIIKGLKPTVEDGIMSYIDDHGHEYVRMKYGDEDFCITAHDYVAKGRSRFEWDAAMMIMEDKGFTTFTKEQMRLYIIHHKEVNDALEGVGGDVLGHHNRSWYWTLDEYDTNQSFCFLCFQESILDVEPGDKSNLFKIRPIINL